MNDVSQGLDATPIWIPQISMGLGTTVLAIAVTDNLVRVIIEGRDNIRTETVESGQGD